MFAVDRLCITSRFWRSKLSWSPLALSLQCLQSSHITAGRLCARPDGYIVIRLGNRTRTKTRKARNPEETSIWGLSAFWLASLCTPYHSISLFFFPPPPHMSVAYLVFILVGSVLLFLSYFFVCSSLQPTRVDVPGSFYPFFSGASLCVVLALSLSILIFAFLLLFGFFFSSFLSFLCRQAAHLSMSAKMWRTKRNLHTTTAVSYNLNVLEGTRRRGMEAEVAVARGSEGKITE